MKYSVIVQITKHLTRLDYDLTDDDDFTEEEVELNMPSFEFKGLRYIQFDGEVGGGFGSYDWSGVLTEAAMKKLLHQLSADVTDERSAGTIGAPGCGYGLVQNIICRGASDGDRTVEIFVTPLLTKRETKKYTWLTARHKLEELAAI